MARAQRTIHGTAEISGKALFSGNEATVRFRPADPSTGILFVRTDLPDSPVVPATVEALGDGFNCTELRWNEVVVTSVEHILSACVGTGVDNLIVEIDGSEPPAAGGNAQAYAEALRNAGVVEQNAERYVLEIQQTVSVSEGEASIVAVPADDALSISYLLEFDEGDIAPQAFSFRLSSDGYMKNLAPARTFAPESARELFEKKSLGGGVTDNNAFVLHEDGSVRTPLSQEEASLKFPDECARHKVLDLLGDLALTNMDVQGKIIAVRSGHKLNNQFAKRLCRLREEQERGPEEYLDIREIQKTLPHRYPFLMVDRILRIEGENKIVGVKNVSVNEQFFQGHYPDYPIMPGVLQLEALAQVAGVLLLQKLEHTGKLALLVSMDSVKMRRRVEPGDQLILEAEAVRIRSRSAQIEAQASVRGELACEAQMRFMLVDADVM